MESSSQLRINGSQLSSNPIASSTPNVEIASNQTENTLEFVEIKNGRSWVWKWFHLRTDKKQVKCLICKKVYEFSTATTNMITHLELGLLKLALKI